MPVHNPSRKERKSAKAISKKRGNSNPQASLIPPCEDWSDFSSQADCDQRSEEGVWLDAFRQRLSMTADFSVARGAGCQLCPLGRWLRFRGSKGNLQKSLQAVSLGREMGQTNQASFLWVVNPRPSVHFLSTCLRGAPPFNLSQLSPNKSLYFLPMAHPLEAD